METTYNYFPGRRYRKAEPNYPRPVVEIAPVQHPTVEAAQFLHSQGLNVFPLPPQQKEAKWPWKWHQRHRYDLDHLLTLIEALQRPNLAVMTGRTSQNLFVFDCENEQEFSQQCQKIRAAGLPLWAVQTARGGHVYLKSNGGEIANRRVSDTLEIRGSNGYVVAPFSIHPSGVVYTWISQEGNEIPVVSLSQLPWLSLETAHRQKKITQSGLHFRQQIERLSQAKRGTRYNTLGQVATSLGWRLPYLDRAEVERQLIEACRENGYLADHGLSVVRSQIRSGLDRGESGTGDFTSKKHKTIQAALAVIKNFRGRTAIADSKVARAIVRRFELSREEIFRASTREIAELARVNRNTASAALERLVKRGFITREGFDETTRASQFSMGLLVRECNFGPLNKMEEDNGPILHSHDAFERGAVGEVGRLVLEGLQKFGPHSPTRLAEQMGITRDRTNYGLRRLLQFGLVERDNGIYHATSRALDEVAEQAGTLGKGDRRSEAHNRQRSAYRLRFMLWKLASAQTATAENFQEPPEQRAERLARLQEWRASKEPQVQILELSVITRQTLVKSRLTDSPIFWEEFDGYPC